MNPIRGLSARSLRVSVPTLLLALASSAFASNQNYVLLSSVAEQDIVSTGPGVDQTTNVTNHYDNKGNLLDTLIVNSGNFDQVQTTTYTNDNKGNPLTSLIEVNSDGAADPDGPNDIDLTAVSTFTYANHGRRTGIDQLVYNDNDQLSIM